MDKHLSDQLLALRLRVHIANLIPLPSDRLDNGLEPLREQVELEGDERKNRLSVKPLLVNPILPNLLLISAVLIENA